MLFSKSKFFKRSHLELKEDRAKVIKVLEWNGIDNSRFLKAYDFFVENPSKFDGATIVKDLCSIRGLDFAAMNHDYFYIVILKQYTGFKWLIEKIKSDYQYGKDMENLGKSIYASYSRVVGLIISTPFYLLIKNAGKAYRSILSAF